VRIFLNAETLFYKKKDFKNVCKREEKALPFLLDLTY